MMGPATQRNGDAAPRARWRRLWQWTRVAPAPLALILVAHFGFGLARFPVGSVQKRLADVANWHRLGVDGWSFRLADEETQRIAHWLRSEVRPGQLVAFTGERQGSMQLLAAVLFPALLVDVASPPDWPLGDVFRGRAPWLAATDGSLPVVVATREALRLEYR